MKIYESALMLSSQAFYQTFESAELVVKPQENPSRDTIKRLYEFLPYPLNPLALLLYWTEREYDVLADQIGCLHIISTIIHPFQWLKAPKEQRMQLGPFGPSIRTEYAYAWKAFIESCIDYEKIINPSESDDKHPIFIINAVPGQIPLGAGAAPILASQTIPGAAPILASPTVPGALSVEIDFDEDMEDPENPLEDGQIAPGTEDTLEKVSENTGYHKLLED